jgi:hypothetical protein
MQPPFGLGRSRTSGLELYAIATAPTRVYAIATASTRRKRR